MAENAILFLEYNKDKAISNYSSFCRKRITDRFFRYPDNIIIDDKERDIAEYIKYLFFEKKESNAQILQFLDHIDYKKINKYLVYARLLFPTNYFDLIEKEKINQKYSKEDIDFIIKNSENYELLLSKISVKYFTNINEVDWLKK